MPAMSLQVRRQRCYCPWEHVAECFMFTGSGLQYRRALQQIVIWMGHCCWLSEPEVTMSATCDTSLGLHERTVASLTGAILGTDVYFYCGWDPVRVQSRATRC